jgi:COP9 signalosome complex subunit 7
MEQYLLLAKRAKGRALVDLIQKATAEPGIFTFAELLDLPLVKEVHLRHILLLGLKSVLH